MERNPPLPHDVEATLRRIESSEQFARSEQSRRLLRILVEATLEGRIPLGKQIGAEFDPRFRNSDEGVRQEVRRLRQRLARYYEDEGSSDEVHVSIPTGSYRVVLERREQVAFRKSLIHAPDPPSDLVAAIAQGDAVLFCGAGLAAQSNLPTWRHTIGSLVQTLFKDGLIEGRELSESLDASLKQGDYETVADLISLRVAAQPGADRFLNRHLRSLAWSGGIRPSESHKILASLPFSCAISSTFDGLIDRSFAQRGPTLGPNETEELKEHISKRTFFILHLNGLLDRDLPINLAPSQLSDQLGRDAIFRECLESLFISRTIFFVGCSIESIDAVLGAIRFAPSAVPHFALVSVKGNRWQSRAEILQRRYNVRLVPFEASRGYPELPAFCGSVAASVASLARGPSASPTTELPANRRWTLLRIRLQNIGPFQNLDIPFQSNWAVLLGGNGVGKSTVLRAISLAFAGKGAADHGTGLLRVGATRGRIELHTANQMIIVDIQRTDRARGTPLKMTFTPERPLEIERDLVIGFPALRSFRFAERQDAGQSARSRPVPEDVLPMLLGDLDTRLSEIRRWLLELDHKSKDERVRGISGGATERLRALFFEALGSLAAGMRIEPDSIDIDLGQINVRTDDGVVPIDSVSQGTSSLMCWVGVVLHRLHEIHGADRAVDFAKQPGLVLIDEIDTHMHPLWQRLLVGKLRRLFPAMQFIVTTHSPLLIGGLSQVEILMFRRDSGIVNCSNPPIDVRGLRADQILTSPLFALDGTRDPETQMLLDRYTELCSRTDLSEREELELKSTSESLGLRVHPADEREEARVASRMIQESFRSQIAAMEQGPRKRLLSELDAQLLEMKSGRRRPS